MASGETLDNEIGEVCQSGSGKVLATLIRLLGDFELAEEAMQEAFATALVSWRKDGVPENPVAWLVSCGRFKGIDIIRRRAKLEEMASDIHGHRDEIERSNLSFAEQEIGDDRLKLIFTCCHPAIDPKVQVALTLREVCGLSTEEIASAFLTSPTAMAQRIVRGKAKIREARIPYVIPDLETLPERLDAVLSVIYLVFNEGYSASSGDSLIRQDLTSEAIRLARLLLELLPDPEVMGLLALMLLHDSRRHARVSSDGDIVLLEKQDRSLWNRGLIVEGISLVRRSLESRRFGVYTIQAAISAVHAEAPTAEATDWSQIVSLYDVLLVMAPSPVVELNRAVAVGMRSGPEEGVAAIDAVLAGGELEQYHLAHSARGELLRRAGRLEDARCAFERALALARQEPERRLLRRRLAEWDQVD